jgi:beta-lactamase class D
VTDDKLIGFNQGRAKTRYSPASTFKIFNALIGLSAGSVKNVDEILPWGWEPQPVKAWEKNMSLRDAMKISNVPIYQELALRTGLNGMQAKINETGYGNMKIGEKLDRFWLDGPLEISAVEQVKLLARLAQNDLPFEAEDMAAVRGIVKLEEGHGWTLYGKTGAADPAKAPQLGWWVGWVEKEGKIYAFALNMDMNGPKDLPKRMEMGRISLENLGILG